MSQPVDPVVVAASPAMWLRGWAFAPPLMARPWKEAYAFIEAAPIPSKGIDFCPAIATILPRSSPPTATIPLPFPQNMQHDLALLRKQL
jgi:hypothetical protein